MSSRNRNAVRLFAVLVITTVIPATGNVARAEARAPGTASFEGRTIDLSNGWGEAAACATDGATTRCFRSEADMDRFLAVDAPAQLKTSEGATSFSGCSTALRLYDGSGFAGSVLNVSISGVWVNLSTYGFDNRTSSYRVGACSSYFAENASGGGAWYPGNTAAWAQASSMTAGWNDRVSSVYQ